MLQYINNSFHLKETSYTIPAPSLQHIRYITGDDFIISTDHYTIDGYVKKGKIICLNTIQFKDEKIIEDIQGICMINDYIYILHRERIQYCITVYNTILKCIDQVTRCDYNPLLALKFAHNEHKLIVLWGNYIHIYPIGNNGLLQKCEKIVD